MLRATFGEVARGGRWPHDWRSGKELGCYGIPDLNALLGVPKPAPHQLPSQPGLDRTRLADAVRQLLQRVAATIPPSRSASR